MRASEDFDAATIFARIYTMKEECRKHDLSERQLNAFWAPMIAVVYQIRNIPVPGPANNAAVIDVDADVDMGDGDSSDWELGSGVDSEAEEATSAIPAA